MLTLIKKDFLIQKRTMLLTIIIAALFLAVWPDYSLTISTVMVSYLLVFGASAYEDKYNSDKLLVSLPISKMKIVLAKYVSVFVFAAYALVLNGLIIAVFDALRLPVTVQPVTIHSILAAVGILTVYVSITLPLIYKFGYARSRAITFIMIFLLMFGIGSLQFEFLTPYSEKIMIILMAAAVLGILAVSVCISLWIFRRKEF